MHICLNISVIRIHGQDTAFYAAKGRVLRYERWPFASRYAMFCNMS